MGDNDNGLTVAEAAEATGYSTGHIRWLARTGRIAARQVGERVYLIDAASLAAYAATMRALGTSKHASRE